MIKMVNRLDSVTWWNAIIVLVELTKLSTILSGMTRKFNL
jgi:hypothetical protein